MAVSVLHRGFRMAVNTYLVVLASVGFVTGLLLAFAARHEVEDAVFKTHAGMSASSVARSGKQIMDYDAFIQRLIQPIQHCESARTMSERVAERRAALSVDENYPLLSNIRPGSCNSLSR